MEDYCEQDVHVSNKLVELFSPKLGAYADSIRLEHDLARIMAKQEASGWPFDIGAGQQLESTLRT